MFWTLIIIGQLLWLCELLEKKPAKPVADSESYADYKARCKAERYGKEN